MKYDDRIKEVLKLQRKLRRTELDRLGLECEIWEKEEELNCADEKEEDKIYSENECLCIPRHLISEIRSNPIHTILKCMDFEKDNVNGTLVLEQFCSDVKTFKNEIEKNHIRKEYKVWFCLSNGESGFTNALELKTKSRKLANIHYKELNNLIQTLTIDDLINSVLDSLNSLTKDEKEHIKQLKDKLKEI